MFNIHHVKFPNKILASLTSLLDEYITTKYGLFKECKSGSKTEKNISLVYLIVYLKEGKGHICQLTQKRHIAKNTSIQNDNCH